MYQEKTDCFHCVLQAVDTELHFLSESTNYTELREQFLHKTSIIYPEIPCQTNEGKLWTFWERSTKQLSWLKHMYLHATSQQKPHEIPPLFHFFYCFLLTIFSMLYISLKMYSVICILALAVIVKLIFTPIQFISFWKKEGGWCHFTNPGMRKLQRNTGSDKHKYWETRKAMEKRKRAPPFFWVVPVRRSIRTGKQTDVNCKPALLYSGPKCRWHWPQKQHKTTASTFRERHKCRAEEHEQHKCDESLESRRRGEVGVHFHEK